jgi:hypothetical protein
MAASVNFAKAWTELPRLVCVVSEYGVKGLHTIALLGPIVAP